MSSIESDTQEPPAKPLEVAVEGFVAVDDNNPDGFTVGGYSSDAQKLQDHANDPVVVDIRRAREIARDEHGWPVSSEHELNVRRMKGHLPR